MFERRLSKTRSHTAWNLQVPNNGL